MMAQLLRMARLAEHCDRTGENPQEALEKEGLGNAGRRQFAKGAIAATATATLGSLAPTAWSQIGKLGNLAFGSGGSGNVAIVGAGLAGLSCATELQRLGITSSVFEASQRVGGRCSSLRGFFPGQVAELGGEFINSSHNVMLGYAQQLGLGLEDYSLFPGNNYFHFGGRMYSEAEVAQEYRAFAASIRVDLETLNHPTADRFSENDALFDFMSLDDYLILHGAGGLLRSVISAAYMSEFGAGIEELSAISFLRFVYTDKRSKLAPFGVFGGEHVRVIEGNDRIASGLAAQLVKPVTLGHKLIAIRKLGGGGIRLTFDLGARRVQSDHDIVVMTLPFSVLRDVQIDASLDLPAWKRLAINSSSQGDNSKLIVGFKQPYWYTKHGYNGTGYSDNPGMQSTWEANPSMSNDSRAVLSAYTGGMSARNLKSIAVQADARSFLNSLETVLPGANAAAQRNARGQILAYSENWSNNPLSKGSHTCNRPGYFTTIAHNEAKPIGNLLFAGEHTNSFYEWQGFMEGAALSGLRAASEVYSLARVK